ncbi:MAG TPA: PAS domain S-box protein [Nitrospirota bacterium]|nr:PAS domain S-box protein [Nitrospirota bacterium]
MADSAMQPKGSLREHDAIFSNLFLNNPLPLWIYDVETLDFLAVNDAMVEQYGFSRQELLSMTILDIRPPEDIPAIREMLAYRKMDMSLAASWRHRKKDGTVFFAEVTSHPILAAGRPARFVMAMDVTSRKRAEDALRRSEEKYRDLFENANDAIFILDSNMRYCDVNRKAVELLGFSKSELLGMGIGDLIPPDEKARLDAEYGTVRNRGAYTTFTGRVRTKQGRWLDVEVNSSAIIMDNRVGGSRDIMRDITERKRMEEEILRAQKLESVGLLAGGIAHDFNNLLSAILGNVTLAKIDAPSGNAAQERLLEAERAVYRAQELTQQLLTFSKGGAPVKRTIWLHDLVRESAALSLRGRKTEGVFALSPDLWPVDADEGQLSQVFNNLAINADQAMPEGGMLKIIGANVTVGDDIPPLAPGRYVKLSFIDAGIGIPSEHVDKIFEPYFTTKETGSGLGLASSFSVVKRHDGHITVETDPRTGTAFHVYLPASAHTPRTRPGDAAAPRGSGRVLVVDDEAMIRDVLEKILQRQGYDPVSVPDGRDAVSLYNESKKNGKPFNVVIMDLTIPGGMGGKEAMAKLLEIDPKVKVIVSSGYSNDPIMAHFRDYGFRGVVTKPFTMNKLSEMVKRVIEE